jgi:hypothetical protein
MNKWKIARNSMTARVAGSSATIVAVSVLVAAGYKWG